MMMIILEGGSERIVINKAIRLFKNRIYWEEIPTDQNRTIARGEWLSYINLEVVYEAIKNYPTVQTGI